MLECKSILMMNSGKRLISRSERLTPGIQKSHSRATEQMGQRCHNLGKEFEPKQEQNNGNNLYCLW
jgi:hypothetical protein